jgi:tetratricopeptide (TPR) repeat protein
MYRMLNPCCLLLCCALCADVRANDTILLTNGLLLEGTIQQENDEYVTVLVYDGAGRVRLHRKQIKEIRYDFASMVAGLDAEDWAGHYKLGLFALEKGKFTEAIERFEYVKDHPEAGPEIHKHLGEAYLKREQWDRAYEAYKEHTKAHPDDAESVAKRQELAKKIGIDENPQPKPEVTAVEPGQPKVPEGLESDWSWTSENPAKWGVNEAQVKVTTDPDTGNKMLAIMLQGGGKDKSAISGMAPTRKSLNFTQTKEALFRIYNQGKEPLRLALAFSTLRGGHYAETKYITVPPGKWVEKTILMEGKVYKAQ